MANMKLQVFDFPIFYLKMSLKFYNYTQVISFLWYNFVKGSGHMPRILIVEDEVEIAEMIRFLLFKEGFQKVTLKHTYNDALAVLDDQFEMYILDINLGDGSGFTLAEKIRNQSDAPIIYVSANTADQDKLRGFKTGADDYITKPFNPMELVARIKANLVRYVGQHYNKPYEFDERRALLTVRGTKHELSGKSYLLMQFLYENQDMILSKERIYEAVWDSHFVDDNIIMVYIRKLRQLLEENPSDPKFLVTARGTGYMLKSGRNL